jgi:hypothetical protein
VATVTISDVVSGPRVSKKNRSAEFDYKVHTPTGADGPAMAEECETAVLAVAPTDYRGWPLDDVIVGPDPQSHNTFIVTVVYAAGGGGELPETGTILVGWDTGGGTAKMNFSKQTVATFPGGGPDLKNAINYKDGKVEGVDVILRGKQLIIKKYVANDDLDDHEAAADECTRKTNNASFFGYAAGEVLMVRARAARRSSNDYEITYEFLVHPNETGVTFAGISSVDKKGHEYAWPLYGEAVAGNELVTLPRYIMVERVYDEADFDLLELE